MIATHTFEGLQVLLLTSALASIRVIAVFSVFPKTKSLFGTPALSAVIAVTTLVMVSSGAGFPAPSETSAPNLGVSFDLILAAFWNAAVGVTVAAPFSIALEAFPMAARLLDTLRGSQFAEQLLPGSESRASALESLAGLAIPLFIFSGGLYRLIIGEAAKIPLTPVFTSGNDAFAGKGEKLISMSSLSISSAVSLVLPAASVVLIFEVTSAILGRLGRKLPIGPELSQLRLLVGLACFGVLLSVTLPVWLEGYVRKTVPLVEAP